MTAPAVAAPPRISLCIPAYDMGGAGAAFLGEALQSAAAQDFRDFEVVVADQSADQTEAGAIRSVVEGFADRLACRRIDTRDLPRQASANTNAAIGAARGDLVKILFQDDYLARPDALARIEAAFTTTGASWLLSGSAHTVDGRTLIRPMVPRYHRAILFGRNTVSSPSVLTLRRDTAPAFDEALIWLMDVEYYRRCHDTLGAPAILPEALVVNRLHPGQVSATITPALVRRELRHVARRHAAHLSAGDRLAYLRAMMATWL